MSLEEKVNTIFYCFITMLISFIISTIIFGAYIGKHETKIEKYDETNIEVEKQLNIYHQARFQEKPYEIFITNKNNKVYAVVISSMNYSGLRYTTYLCVKEKEAWNFYNIERKNVSTY